VKQDLPSIGARVITSAGTGIVVGINPASRMVSVRVAEAGNRVSDFPLDDVAEQEA
jgi:hypothetical protein